MYTRNKLDVFDNRSCRTLWGEAEVEWVFKEAKDNSGGLLCLWNRNSFTKLESFSGSGLLGVKGIWGSS